MRQCSEADSLVGLATSRSVRCRQQSIKLFCRPPSQIPQVFHIVRTGFTQSQSAFGLAQQIPQQWAQSLGNMIQVGQQEKSPLLALSQLKGMSPPFQVSIWCRTGAAQHFRYIALVGADQQGKCASAETTDLQQRLQMPSERWHPIILAPFYSNAYKSHKGLHPGDFL